MAAVTAAPDWFTLRIPESWFEFSPWRATRTGTLGRLVDARIAEAPSWRPHRSGLLKLLRAFAEMADRQGAIYCAAAADIAGEDGLLASLLVFHTPGEDDPRDNTVEAIAGQIVATPPTGPGQPWRTVALVDLPAGRAVRVRGVERTTAGETPNGEARPEQAPLDGTSVNGTSVNGASVNGAPVNGAPVGTASVGTAPIDGVMMQTLIPVPAGGGVLNVVLTSPHTALADDLLGLFEAISETLSWSDGRPSSAPETSSYPEKR
jgi:hypothetical protein